MRILFIGKREPQGRDLLTRPYGRFHHLPVELAARGHDVVAALASHRGAPDATSALGGVRWIAVDARHHPLLALRRITGLAMEVQPDWIVGISDAWYGWLAHHLARRTGARLAVDAYDDYESYMPWNLPLHAAWRRAVAAADAVTVAGPTLGTLLDRHRSRRAPSAIVPMAADPTFQPRDKRAARDALSLDPDAPLVGYFGAWARARGTALLIDAFRQVRAHRPDARLVLTGAPPPQALAEPGVHALGFLPDARLPDALAALDVACVVTADTAFGRQSHPAKLCEAMASRVPVVATATAPVRWMLDGDADSLVPVGDADAIARRVLALLADHRPPRYPDAPRWPASVMRFEQALALADRVS